MAVTIANWTIERASAGVCAWQKTGGAGAGAAVSGWRRLRGFGRFHAHRQPGNLTAPPKHTWLNLRRLRVTRGHP
jgi:hypothetical protein|eukprot:COSAG01_NODE_1710_length_9422_cov_11.759412_13_plen_75_part_00